MRMTLIALVILTANAASEAMACEGLDSLVGWTLAASTNVEKDELHRVSEGSQEIITLRNEWSFKFDKTPKDRWGVGLRATVYVFSRTVSEAETREYQKYGLTPPVQPLYILLIDGSPYEAKRLR